MDGKFHIKLQIVGRYYPLLIERKDEERFRKAAKLINDKVAQYKLRYKDKDNQDFLSMAALQFVLKELDLEEKIDERPVVSAIEELTDELEAFVKKE
ncbi:MAG: cell division protein ZapA [Bacteroidetes bacterium]|jgi:cell division protein ZapA|nr:cell division protein ZapA [Bacteroidota bacterium]MBT3749089.1 cell division protein ZapA [Bacteroidota bacterium]MBT4409166.1 cell division protein ZapA [Bacteroidota bacterium]MBT5426106.1 cell division protein ZapA [Bacteroidota bacterium]MBT7094753.1 cell division protein ZapA [Bacteroidota bacterium]